MPRTSSLSDNSFVPIFPFCLLLPENQTIQPSHHENNNHHNKYPTLQFSQEINANKEKYPLGHAHQQLMRIEPRNSMLGSKRTGRHTVIPPTIQNTHTNHARKTPQTHEKDGNLRTSTYNIRQGSLPSVCPSHVINNNTKTPNTSILNTYEGGVPHRTPRSHVLMPGKASLIHTKIRETNRNANQHDLQHDTPCK